MPNLGGTLSSGYTNSLNDQAIYCGIPSQAARAQSDQCCKPTSGQSIQPAQLSSTYLQKKGCTVQPTPAQFALYPKVAITQSSYTQRLLTNNCATLPDPSSRFPQRFIPPPCVQQALPVEAYLAGRSLPSRACLFAIPYGN